MAQNYIIVRAIPPLSSMDRCIDLSTQIYKISRPLDDPEQITQYQFSWLVNPNGIDYALIVDLNAMIPVSPDKNLADLIALMGPDVPQSEINQIVTTINNQNPVRFADIIPVEVPIRSEQYMIDNGWITPNPL